MIETTLPLWEVAAREIGERAGRACAAKAEAAGFDADSARAEILAALEIAGRPMSGEELVDVCLAAGIVPHDCRAFEANNVKQGGNNGR